jgi:hypothetical protein
MAKSILVFDDLTQVSLESQLERLAIESNVLANVIDTFRNIIPNLKHQIDEIKVKLTSGNNSNTIKHCETLFKHISPKIKYANYTNYSHTLVSVPEGFKGNFLEYINVLNKIVPEVYTEANKILGEYCFALSTFITNKEDKISLKDHTNLFHRINEHREQTVNTLSVFFPTTNPQSKQYLGNVIGRFYELEQLVDSLKFLDKVHSDQNLNKITSQVNTCCDLLDIVIKNSQKEEMNTISGNAAKNISEGAYAVGKYIEFVSVVRFKTEQAIVSVERLMETLDKVIK